MRVVLSIEARDGREPSTGDDVTGNLRHTCWRSRLYWSRASPPDWFGSVRPIDSKPTTTSSSPGITLTACERHIVGESGTSQSKSSVWHPAS